MESIKTLEDNRIDMALKILASMIIMLILQTEPVYGDVNAKIKLFGSKKSEDTIIKSDGSVVVAKVKMVTPDYTYYEQVDGSIAGELVCSNADIYMISFSDRGNMFLGGNGTLFFGEDNDEADDDAVLIYLIKGEEIVAYDVMSTGQEFRYFISKKKSDSKTIPVGEVFMIKYPNRPHQIITPLENTDANVYPVENIEIPKDTFVELKEAKPAMEYIIKNNKKDVIRALVVYGNDEFVSFYRKEMPNGPLYRMDRSEIKSITPVQTRKKR